MSIYDPQEQQIARQLAIAKALRDSGNFGLDRSTMSSGRYIVPISPFESLSKIAQGAIGSYAEAQANKQNDALTQKKQSDLADFLKGVGNVQNPAPDTLMQPAQVTDTYKPDAQMPEDDAMHQHYVDSLNAVNQVATPDQETDTGQRNARIAQYMKGMQMGGPAGDIGGALMQREVVRPVKQPFTLNEGDVRFDENGKPIAVGAPKAPPAGDRELQEIIDPKALGGHRTIERKNFVEGRDQAWIKPTAGEIASAGLSGGALDQAADFYRKFNKLPPGFSRAPAALIKVMNRAADMDAAEGNDAAAATRRKVAGQSGQAALTQISKLRVVVSAFERDARADMKMARDAATKADNTGVPFVNQWLNAGKKNITGSKEYNQWFAANETFIAKYAKIMSGSMGNTPASDAAAAHAHDILNTAMNPDSYQGVLDILDKEMTNRINGMDSEKEDLLKEIAGNPSTSSSTSSGSFKHLWE